MRTRKWQRRGVGLTWTTVPGWCPACVCPHVMQAETALEAAQRSKHLATAQLLESRINLAL